MSKRLYAVYLIAVLAGLVYFAWPYLGGVTESLIAEAQNFGYFILGFADVALAVACFFGAVAIGGQLVRLLFAGGWFFQLLGYIGGFLSYFLVLHSLQKTDYSTESAPTILIVAGFWVFVFFAAIGRWALIRKKQDPGQPQAPEDQSDPDLDDLDRY